VGVDVSVGKGVRVGRSVRVGVGVNVGRVGVGAKVTAGVAVQVAGNVGATVGVGASVDKASVTGLNGLNATFGLINIHRQNKPVKIVRPSNSNVIRSNSRERLVVRSIGHPLTLLTG
jgi:hypothetical protein